MKIFERHRAAYTTLGPILLVGLLLWVYYRRLNGDPEKYIINVPKILDVLVPYDSEHPISQLVHYVHDQSRLIRARQSKSLEEAIQEYQRRYAMHPPPHFDKWYEFAMERGTELVDEYDEIHKSLYLFWALKPAVIRARTIEVLGGGNMLMGVSIRNGAVHIIGRGQGEFQATATHEMISKFAAQLPDMDLAFNVNDEPRIVIPSEDVDRMTKMAHESIRLAMQSRGTQHITFTRPDDLNNGTNYPGVSDSRFNHLDHQQTWAHARMSCPPGSPARNLGGNTADYDTTFAFGALHFVYNITAFSDVCLTPSLRNSIGAFNHPNVFAISHDLVPVFSTSKLSTFHDILYPSPYYYADKAVYDDGSAVQWEEKTSKLYWRGATSGGYSESGIWRKLLRQSVASKLMVPGNAKVLEQDASGSWAEREVSGDQYKDSYDVKFTEIKQCDPRDCAEMRDYFGIDIHVPQEDAWGHRYLLDMDGNGFSGRFYALLKSNSLPFKLAYFREWHSGRVLPWKHYVPVSAETEEYAEIIRYFEDEPEGQTIAKRLGSDGRDWANRSLRRDDMEVYMFRLLLEYGRLVDENRDNLG